MTYVDPRLGTPAGDDVIVVRPPRVTDAIGSTLRDAFGGHGLVPSEWKGSLDALDRYR